MFFGVLKQVVGNQRNSTENGLRAGFRVLGLEVIGFRVRV